MNYIILFTGLTGCGKTTISAKLTKMLSGEYNSCSEVMNQYAIANGYKRSKYWIAQVGMKNVYDIIRPTIKNKILKFDNDILFVDSFYDFKLYRELLSIENLNLQTFAILADKDFRFDNFSKRENSIISDFEIIDKYKVEVGVLEVMNCADYKIENTPKKSINCILNEVCQYIDKAYQR